MKKIYYLQKYEVKLGDIIEYNGIKALVTEGLIELNPELFKIEEEKTLKDYESNLFESMQTNVYSSNNRHYFSVWSWIKDNEPKLYYTKILQLIADDLHGGRHTHIHMDTSYHIDNTCVVNVHCGDDEGCVYFRSNELAEKARVILGDKVKYLFN